MENGKMTDKVQKNEAADRVADRDKALAAAMVQIEKQFGKGSVMKLGDHPDRALVPAISTGSLSLDAALGIGGLPRGRIVEIMVRREEARPLLLSRQLPRHRRRGAGRRSSTLSMLLTPCTPATSEST